MKSNEELWREATEGLWVDAPGDALRDAFAAAVRADERQDARLTLRDTMQRIVNDHPLSCEFETDARYIWPKRWAALEAAIPNAGNAPALKPCPFCGGEAQTDFAEPDHYMIECREKSCRVRPWSLEKTEVAAIAAWNKRA